MAKVTSKERNTVQEALNKAKGNRFTTVIPGEELSYAAYFTLQQTDEYEIQFWFERSYLASNTADIWCGFWFNKRYLFSRYQDEQIIGTTVSKTPDNGAKLRPQGLYSDSFRDDGELYVGYYRVLDDADLSRLAAVVEAQLAIWWPKLVKIRKRIDAEMEFLDKLLLDEGSAPGWSRAGRSVIDAIRKKAEGRCGWCGQDMHKLFDKLPVLHVHHKNKRFSELKPGAKIKESEMVALCPNCHVALHLLYPRGTKLGWPPAFEALKQGSLASR